MSHKLPSDSADTHQAPSAVGRKRRREVLLNDMQESMKEVKAKLHATPGGNWFHEYMPFKLFPRRREVLLKDMDESLKEVKAKLPATEAWKDRTQREIRQLQEKNEDLARKLEQHEGQKTTKRTCNGDVEGSNFEEMEGSTSRSLQLKFTSQPSLKIFTMTKVTGENSEDLGIVLVDPLTRQVVSSGPEASIEVELVLVHGDFGCESGNWKLKDFMNNIIHAREGKRPLLVGDFVLRLNGGRCVVGKLKITDNSVWVRSRRFRLAATVADGYVNGMRIKEAITNSFEVMEGRLKSSQKHYPPSPNDEVWRLVGIARNSVYRNRLTMNGIVTVEDFLKSLAENRKRLQDNILEMPTSDWEVTVNHAETCILSGKMVTGPTFNPQLDPGCDISQATEEVNGLSVQAVHESHKPVEAVQNDTSLYHQQSGESSLLKQHVTSQSVAASSHTAVRNWGDTSSSRDTSKNFGLGAGTPLNPGELPAAGMNSSPNELKENFDRLLGDEDSAFWPQDIGSCADLIWDCLQFGDVHSADSFLTIPEESTARKHRACSKWSALRIAMAFSTRIVAFKDMELETS